MNKPNITELHRLQIVQDYVCLFMRQFKEDFDSMEKPNLTIDDYTLRQFHNWIGRKENLLIYKNKLEMAKKELQKVWERKWKKIYIDSDIVTAKEFSEYIKFWVEAIDFFEKTSPKTLLKLNKQHNAKCNWQN